MAKKSEEKPTLENEVGLGLLTGDVDNEEQLNENAEEENEVDENETEEEKNSEFVEAEVDVEVVYLCEHGNYSKGDVATMQLSTAKALKIHQIVKINK